MRLLPLAVLALTLPASGCAALLAASGREPQSLTEERVKAEHPDAVATTAEDGTSVLAFRTREKIANRGKMYAMGYVITLGLGEFVWFPIEAYGATRTALFGRDVVVRYDSEGKVKRVTVDGEPTY